jgi:hypothetical protein
MDRFKRYLVTHKEFWGKKDIITDVLDDRDYIVEILDNCPTATVEEIIETKTHDIGDLLSMVEETLSAPNPLEDIRNYFIITGSTVTTTKHSDKIVEVLMREAEHMVPVIEEVVKTERCDLYTLVSLWTKDARDECDDDDIKMFRRVKRKLKELKNE